MVNGIEDLFPGLVGKDYQFTSPADEVYNCIAWAAGNSQDWWWPDARGRDYWPEGVPRVETVAAFIQAFACIDFVPCDNESYEPGFEKIALFATTRGQPKHAARQLVNGLWTSKLGRLEDIEHALHDLEGEEYGSVVQILKRPAAVPPA